MTTLLLGSDSVGGAPATALTWAREAVAGTFGTRPRAGTLAAGVRWGRLDVTRPGGLPLVPAGRGTGRAVLAHGPPDVLVRAATAGSRDGACRGGAAGGDGPAACDADLHGQRPRRSGLRAVRHMTRTTPATPYAGTKPAAEQ